MDDESVLEFNFWPSFADLMLTLVLILVIVIFSVYASLAVGTVNLKTERDNQKKVVNEIAAAFNVKPDSIGPDKYAISITNKTSPDIMIEQHLDVQRFSFSDQILFDRNEFILKPSGITALKVVGGKIKGQLDKIIEIQIQGHADKDPSHLFRFSNMELASNRAIQVFYFMKDSLDINPADHLMSATSFGEYKPVQRDDAKSSYNDELLEAHNSTPDLKAQNRRIELVLKYRGRNSTISP